MKNLKTTVFFSMILLVILGYQAALGAKTIDQMFEEANAAYSRGDFQTAINDYEQITKQSGFSASLLFNLANAYARDGNIGKAIANYERALLISPNDSDILGNLQLVKKESGLFVKEYSTFEKFISKLSFNQWALLLLASLAALAVFFIVSLFSFISRKNSVIFSALWIIVFSLFSVGSYVSYQKFNPSIVISPGARLLISPFDNAASVGKIQEGRHVYPIKKHKTYTYVVDETDRKGWITNNSVEAVCKPLRSKHES